MKYLIFFILALTVGCASVSKRECETLNWEDRGEIDAKAGIKPSKIADYSNDCLEHGLKVPVNAYKVGHEKGLISFCSYDRGVKFGEDGNNNPNMCTGPAKIEFDRGFQLGEARYEAEQARKKREQEQDEQMAQMKKQQDELQEQHRKMQEEIQKQQEEQARKDRGW